MSLEEREAVATKPRSVSIDLNNLKMGNRSCFVYILTNKNYTVFYTGVTNDLTRHVGNRVVRLAKVNSGDQSLA